MAIAIIPARAGSKGIKNKNIQPLNGLPLITHSILAAMNAESIDQVYVTTDGDEIARVATMHGAIVVRQPPEISGDRVISETAILHLLSKIEQPDTIVFLQCTCPLVTPQDIDGAMDKFKKTHADSLLAVSRFSLFIWEEDENGEAKGVSHDHTVRLQRQLMKPQYLESGALYIMDTAGFQKAKHRFFGKTVLYEMPVERSVDINNSTDLKIAEVLSSQS